MTIPMLSAGRPYRFLCILLALVMATAPSFSLFVEFAPSCAREKSGLPHSTCARQTDTF